ncbi:M23 family metallopeptidase [Candidatus Dojkabacteria bacterium]|jgi:hypothetical protein|nr:M23 family metallopeptidase [Candidatus Dojkabacteria bacterium]
MGKKKSPKFEDALQAISDFIFTQKKQRPVKTRPTKYQNVDGNRQMAAALTEIASKPLNYVSDATLKHIENFGSTELVKFYVDKKAGDDESGRARVRVSDLAKVLQNPDKFVDSAFDSAKADRKAARHLNIGRGMEMAMTFLWAQDQAKRAGLEMKIGDAWNFGMSAGDFVGAPLVSISSKKLLEASAMKTLRILHNNPQAARDVDRLLSETPGVIRGAGGADKLEKVLRRSPNPLISGNARGLATEIMSDFDSKYSRYHNAAPKDAEGEIIGVDKNEYISGEAHLNRLGYSGIWTENLWEKIKCLDPLDPRYVAKKQAYMNMIAFNHSMNKLKGSGPLGFAKPEDILGNLGKMGKALDGISRSNDPSARRYQAQLQAIYARASRDEEVKGLRQLEKAGKRWIGLPYHYDSKYIRKSLDSYYDFEIKRNEMILDRVGLGSPRGRMVADEIALLNMERRAAHSIPMSDFAVAFNDIVGAYRSIDAEIFKGGLVNSIITGSFFGGGSFLSPSRLMEDEREKMMFKFRRRGGWNPNDRTQTGLKIKNIVIPRGDINPGIASLATLYYFTPQSIFKTLLYNGEGFAYMGYLNRAKVANVLNDRAINAIIHFGAPANRHLLAELTKGGFINLHSGFIDRDMVAVNFEKFCGIVRNNAGLFPPQITSMLNKALQFDENIGSILLYFNAPARALGTLSGIIDKKLFLKIRTVFANTLKKLFKLDDTLVSEYIARNVGIKQLITGIVRSILEAAGVGVGGPLGAVLATVLAWLLEDVVYKLAKPMTKIFIFFLWGILFGSIGAFIVVLMILFPTGMGVTGSFQHILPGTATEGAMSNPFSGLYPISSGTVDDSVYDNAPTGNTCPIYQSLNCTQGNAGRVCTSATDTGCVSSSHHLNKAMDTGPGIWYAPDSGTVTRAETTSSDCNGPYSNRGGTVVFETDAGVQYKIYHIMPIVSAGTHVGAGVAIGRSNTASEIGGGSSGPGGASANWCWTGPHFHLEVINNGVRMDAVRWYKQVLKCSVGCSGQDE